MIRKPDHSVMATRWCLNSSRARRMKSLARLLSPKCSARRAGPDVETAAVIAAFGLATSFSSAVTKAARKAAQGFDTDRDTVPPDREDLTESVIFTIDPPDARDFDDAISISWDKKSREVDAWCAYR